MPLVYPGQNNTFVPSFDATGQLVVGYSRNPKDFPVNKYITIVPVKRSIGYYLKLTAENAARILNSNLSDFMWPDGNDAPSGEWNNESFNFLSYNTLRYTFPFRLGYKAIQQADWKILATEAANHAQQAMTGRALNVATLLLTASNWSSTHVFASGTALTTGPAGSTAGNLTAGTGSNQLLKKAINRMAQIIQRSTLGVVRPRDLVLVISPTAADALSRSAEIGAYLANSPWALAQVRGDSPSQNGLWGLPDALYGVPLVIEDTVIVPYRKNFSASSLAAPTLTVGAATSGGALAAGTYYYKITSVFGPGESVGSSEQSGTTSGGNLTLPLSWTAVPYAVKYNIYRGTASGLENVLIASVSGLSYNDIGNAGLSATPPGTGNAFLQPLYLWEQQTNSPNPMVMLSRPGQLVSQGTSTFSTAVQFMFEEMTVESRDDPDNRRTMGRVTEDYATVLTSDISGALCQDILS